MTLLQAFQFFLHMDTEGQKMQIEIKKGVQIWQKER